MAKCADAQFSLEMHRMLRTVPIVFIKTTRYCLNSKGHGNHQETHGKEILTKGVVLKRIKAVATVSVREATCQNFFVILWKWRAKPEKKKDCLWESWCSMLLVASSLPSLPPSLPFFPPPHLSHTHHPCPHNPLLLLSFPSLLPTQLHAPPPPSHPTHPSRPYIETTTKRWPRVHFRSSCAIHQSSRLRQSQHSQHDELQEKKQIMWRAAVNNDKCDFDSNFLTPFC